MNDNWKTYSLSSIMDIIGGGTPKTDVPEYWNGDIPWLSVTDITKGSKKIYTTEKFITERGLRESSTKLLKEGQIIITARGTVGEIAMIGKEMAFNQTCYGLQAREQTTNDYLYYVLKSNVSRIKQMTHGAVFNTITKQTFENIEVTIPENLETQLKISTILSSLDDKIELNLKMNKTLESIAQAIFKRWFVDFQFPGFTGEMENGLPKGWNKKSILEIAELLSGGTPKTEIPEYWNGEIDWISAKDISANNGTFILESEKKISSIGLENSNAKILPAFTTVITARGSVGNYSILSKEMTINQTNYGLKIKNCNGDIFLFLLISNIIDQLQQSSYGTIFDTITTRTFRDMLVTFPPIEIIEMFDTQVKPFMEKILKNLYEIKILSKIRDSLLPKLITGQIKVGGD